MSTPLSLHPDRLFPADPTSRDIARRLYEHIKNLPIISPHGHTDPAWFAENTPFANATELFIQPDHYLYRMLYSLGISLEQLGISAQPGAVDQREVWRLFAAHYYAFRGTPSRLWLDSVFAEVFQFDETLCTDNADQYYDTINAQLTTDRFRPRALFDQFNIEVLATTESPLDDLAHHKTIQQSDWNGRVITTYRPDPVVDPEYEGFAENIKQLAEITGEDTTTWSGYMQALRVRRDFFKSMGATATDHGHPSAFTADLNKTDCEELFAKVRTGNCLGIDAELFRGQLLTEMAGMSLDDGLVMQLHSGSLRNHNPWLFQHYGRDKGADIPQATNYVNDLQPLLNKYGNERDFKLIVFTLDETTYARELAPLAGHYPCLKLGPAWWFHDSPEGMRRFREQTTETAGFYNTVGFNDDTRAFLSIPARHDVARRMDCSYLAELVADHRLPEDEAAAVAADLAYHLAKQAYKL